MVKNPPANAGDPRDVGSIPGSGRSPGGGHGNRVQYSCLENPMARGLEAAENHSPQSLMSAQKTHQNDSLPRVSFSQAVVVGVGQCL